MKELISIQSELKAPKGQYNKFGKYNYRSCEDIVEAVKPILLKHGCLMTLSDEMVEVGGRVYVKATATIKNSTGETESATGYAREAADKKGMDDSQITGSTSSYARKYACNGLLMIDDTKDSDATNDHGKGQQQQTQQPKEDVHPMRNWAIDFLTHIKNATGPDDLTVLISKEENAINDCTPVMVNEFKKAIHTKTQGSFKWPTYLKGK